MTFSMPRIRERVKPRTFLMMPKTGSTVDFRCWYFCLGVVGLQSVFHALSPLGFRFGRPEVLEALGVGPRHRDQHLDAARLDRRHRRAIGEPGVAEHRRRPADRGAHGVDGGAESRRVAWRYRHIGGQHQLAALGIHHRLGVVALAILVALGLAHQLAVGVGQGALQARRKKGSGRKKGSESIKNSAASIGREIRKPNA